MSSYGVEPWPRNGQRYDIMILKALADRLPEIETEIVSQVSTLSTQQS